MLPYPDGARGICAHRGASSIAPENTLYAFETAIAMGARFLEADVRLSADGELVVLHDETLERTTNVASRPEFSQRRPWPTHGFSARELASLNAGQWFLDTDPKGGLASEGASDAARGLIAAQRVPTLQQLLALCSRHNVVLNLEIKDHAGLPGDELVVPRTLDALDTLNALNTQDAQDALTAVGCGQLVLLSSFRHEYLTQAKRLNPAVCTAALVEDGHPDDLVDYLTRLGVSAYHPEHVLVDAAMVAELHAAGLRVNTWTVNDLATARALLHAGVDSLITDWPQRLLQLG